jgi:hypothetical protein
MPLSRFSGPICIRCGLEITLGEPDEETMNQEPNDASQMHPEKGRKQDPWQS